jgi:hypothetical protein
MKDQGEFAPCCTGSKSMPCTARQWILKRGVALIVFFAAALSLCLAGCAVLDAAQKSAQVAGKVK